MRTFDNNKNPDELVTKYEQCLLDGHSCYFDVDELEVISDFYLKKGCSKESTEVVDLGLKLHPNSSILLLKKAMLYLEIGETHHALHILDRLPEKDDTEAHLIRSECLLQLNRREEALRLMHQIMDEELFEKSDLALDIAGILVQASEFKAAIGFIQEARVTDAKNLDLLFELAYNFEQIGQPEDALDIYRQILDIDPYSSETWFNLGQAHFNQKQYVEAIEAYDFALVVNPDDHLALLQKAHALFQNEQFTEAAEIYLEYGKATEMSSSVWVYVGEAYEKSDHIEQAMDCYRVAYEMDPKNVDALTGMGICLMEKEQYRESLIWFERSLRIDHQISELWVYVAEVFVNIDMPEEAMLSYLRSLEIDPTQADIHAAVGNLHFDAGQYEQALLYYNKAELISADLPGLHLFYALVYAKTGDSELSMHHLTLAIALEPASQKIFDEIINEHPQRVKKNPTS